MSAISHTLDLETPWSPELTAPLVSPEIVAGFEALLDGRCSLSDLSRSVQEACRSDPDSTDGVLQQLEDYSTSGEFDRFDFGPLQRVLQGIGRPPCDTNPIDPCSDDQMVGSDNQIIDSDNQAVDLGAEPNTLRGRYILAGEIGRGGVGTVYRALDLNRVGLPREHQYVALKVLNTGAAPRPDAVQALRREYHQAQLLSHPGIVNVFDFDHEGDTYFVSMELLDGESLGALTRRLQPNELPPETALRILRELGDAVAYAHDRGVLHLDLKPDNVMIDAEGRVRVLDFGLAQKHTDPWLSDMHASPAAATPAYASCERLVQERPDVRDDIFSFSCIAYELLTGKHPFERRSALHARKEGLEARRIKGLSHRQWHALKSGLAWAREDRPANMQELLQGLALEPNVPPNTAAAGTKRRALVAVGLLVLGVAGMMSWSRMHDADGRASAGGGSLARNATTPGPADAMSPASAETIPSAALDDTIIPAPEVTTTPTSAVDPATADATATPSIPITAPAIESADAVVEPQPPSTDARGDTGDFVAAVARSSERPSNPRPLARAVQAFSDAPRSTPPLDVLGFSRHSVPLREADGVARVNVARTGSATGDISFQWYTVADSATAVQDFVYEYGEERMAPGQTTATLVVPIVADSIHENPELLQVVIANPHGARVGAAGRVPIIIVDGRLKLSASSTTTTARCLRRRRRLQLLCPVEPFLNLLPLNVREKRVDVFGGGCAVVDLVGVLVHVHHENGVRVRWGRGVVCHPVVLRARPMTD
jgi:serine/threonine protein kinase